MAVARASIKGHPIHPALVTIPIGLWTATILADLVYVVRNEQFWLQLSFWTDISGVAFAVLAAIFGLWDYSTIDDRKLKKIATFHMMLNFFAVAVFGIAGLLLFPSLSENSSSLLVPIALLLQSIGYAGVVFAGYLGGEMVFRHRMGVKE